MGPSGRALPGEQEGLSSTVFVVTGVGRDVLNSHCGWLGSHTASGKLLNLSEPQFPLLKKGS